MSTSLKTYYSTRAADYDQIHLRPERQSDLRAMERWLPDQLAGRRLLELACGTGYWTQFVASVARRIVATDAVPEPLETARKRIYDGHVRFRIADAYDIPPHLGPFDAAFAGFWFSHIPRSRRRDILQQLHERLEPGSRVILLDNLYVEGSSTRIAETDPDGNTYQLRKLADGSTHRVLKNFPTELELLTLVDGIGTRAQFTLWQYYWGLTYVTVARHPVSIAV